MIIYILSRRKKPLVADRHSWTSVYLKASEFDQGQKCLDLLLYSNAYTTCLAVLCRSKQRQAR